MQKCVISYQTTKEERSFSRCQKASMLLFIFFFKYHVSFRECLKPPTLF